MDIDVAVVLCAGRATRLWPLTFARPKALLPVANRPMVAWVLQAIRDAGINEAILVVPQGDRQIRGEIGDGAAFGMKISYAEQEEPRGLADAVAAARDAVGERPFLVYLGDDLLPDGIASFVETVRSREPDGAVLLKEVEDPRRYGVVELRGDRVVRLVEKPQEPPSNLAVVGVYAFKPSFFEAIEKTEPSARGEVEITDAIQHYVDDGHEVIGVECEGPWIDAGELDSLLLANQLYLERISTGAAPDIGRQCVIVGPVQVSGDVEIVDCQLRGPVAIGARCSIYGAKIGPYVSIGPGTTIRDCTVRNSIIGAGCTIRRAGTLEGAIIGDGAWIEGPGEGMNVRIVAADRSIVRIEPAEGEQ